VSAPAAQHRFLRLRAGDASETLSFASPSEVAERTAGRTAGPIWPVLVGCLALAAATLYFPSTPTYDPWAWILWGREIVHFDLVTTGGPSWKPLPVLFTVPFSLLGHDASPYLWVIVARAGGFLACAMAFRMTRRLVGGVPGIVGGIAAAAALFSSFKFVRDAALGNSEALMAGLILWAFERHLDGRRDHALYLGVAGALLRPEVWPFLGLYGLWLWFKEPQLRLRMAIFAVLIPALWCLPEWWGSHEPLRAFTRATKPNPGSAAFADDPAMALVKRFRKVVIAPVKAGVVIAIGYAVWAYFRERRERVVLAMAAGGVAWFALIAFMTAALGTAGNQRYLIVSTLAASVLGGIGAGRALQGFAWAGTRASGSARVGAIATAVAFVVALAVAAPFIRPKFQKAPNIVSSLEYEARIWHDIKHVIDRAGGPKQLADCGGRFSGPFQTQMIAWELNVHGIQVGWKGTPPPGVLFQTRTVPDGPLVAKPTDDRFREVARYGKLRLFTVPPTGRTSCPVAGPGAPRVPRPKPTG
jgi:hypothetical protein